MTAGPSTRPARIPPGRNSSVPVACQVHKIAKRKKAHRGREQDPQVRSPRLARFKASVVRDERIGRKGQDLVEEEKRKQVARKGDTQRRENRHRKTRVEARLVLFAVAPAIPNGVERGGDPKSRGHQRVQHAQRLHGESERHSGKHLQNGELRASAFQHAPKEARYHEEGEQRRADRDRFAHVGPPAGRKNPDRSQKGQSQSKADGRLGRHQPPPPRSWLAAALATETVQSA